MGRLLTLCCSVLLLCNAIEAADKKPLKVFILAGQSNMEGHAHVRVIDYMGEDPETAPLLKKMKNKDGSYRKIPNTYISYLTGEQGRLNTSNREVFGQLEIGFGNQGGRDYDKPGEKLGPELAFGITVQEELDQPILIIKTAWGGQSLHTDYRSPSSGPYVPSKDDIERGRFDTAEKKQELKAKTGLRYRQMIEHVEYVLGDIKRVVPDYDPAQGYELAGFAWFQGFNDMVGRNVYPDLPQDSDANQYAKYSEWMANFIRDVRKDLKAPEMPFAIGVMGVGGEIEKMEPRQQKTHTQFRAAMAAPASMPEFKGNVFAVQTSPFWDEKLDVIDKKTRRHSAEGISVTNGEQESRECRWQDVQRRPARIPERVREEFIHAGRTRSGSPRKIKRRLSLSRLGQNLLSDRTGVGECVVAVTGSPQ